MSWKISEKPENSGVIKTPFRFFLTRYIKNERESALRNQKNHFGEIVTFILFITMNDDAPKQGAPAADQ
jgi:hypothetical protein